MKHGDRVLVLDLLRTPHYGTIRSASSEFVLVDIELPSGSLVAHMFDTHDPRLAPLG